MIKLLIGGSHLANYPDTVQIGDAFRVREDGWRLLDVNKLGDERKGLFYEGNIS